MRPTAGGGGPFRADAEVLYTRSMERTPHPARSPRDGTTTSGARSVSGPARLSLRPIEAHDLPFLRRLYAATRSEEMAATGWSPERREALLAMQFDAQHRHFQRHFPEADFDLVLLDGAAIGRRYLDRRPGELRLIDIALLPEHRNRGLGGALLAELLREADRVGRPVRLHVDVGSPARRLYRRLGFTPLEERGLHLFMERAPKRPERI